MSSPNFAELLATFVEQLEAQPQGSWWERFYADCPDAAVLASKAAEIIQERPLSELMDHELHDLENLLGQLEAVAGEYAAARGESVPPQG